jgi:hypothetical protein
MLAFREEDSNYLVPTVPYKYLRLVVYADIHGNRIINLPRPYAVKKQLQSWSNNEIALGKFPSRCP